MSSVAVPDRELGVLARGGDVQALAALLERCRPSLYATAMGLPANRADALDAVQDTCVVALVRLGDLRDDGALRAWLHSVVCNICLMRLRQRREITTPDIQIQDTVPGPEQVFEQHAMRDWVWQALKQLSSDERVTLMLRHFTRSSSYEAIAQITAVPVGTVRSRLSRARSRLADALLNTVAGTALSHSELESGVRHTWEEFYRILHERPVPRTYRGGFARRSSTCWPAATSPCWRSTSATLPSGRITVHRRRAARSVTSGPIHQSEAAPTVGPRIYGTHHFSWASPSSYGSSTARG